MKDFIKSIWYIHLIFAVILWHAAGGFQGVLLYPLLMWVAYTITGKERKVKQ